MRRVCFTFVASFALPFAALASAAALAVAGPAPAPIAPSSTPPLATAIITSSQAVLRAAPRDSAQQQAQLWQGETVEVRGERLDYLQVWDHRRERGGYVHTSQLQRVGMSAADASDLLAVLRHVAARPGNEALGIGLAAAYLKAAPADMLQGVGGVEAFDALGTLADRLARRASVAPATAGTPPLSKSTEAAIAAHLDVAAHYGVQFNTYEQEGRMQVCYNGEAFRRVLAMRSQPEQRARAALALTRPECTDPSLRPAERAQLDVWRADVLDRADAAAVPGYLKNRLLLRRATLWSGIAWTQARQSAPAEAPAHRAIDALTGINKAELTDDDIPLYNDAAMRVNAVRWAAIPDDARRVMAKGSTQGGLELLTQPGQPGETCVLLVDGKNGAGKPLAKRCTYAIVWPQSVSFNREGTALALAVQPMEAWRELWVFRKEASGWTVNILPPSTNASGIGYAEFAGWVPGGTQLLAAREARSEGRYKRNFEIVRVAGLTTDRQAAEPSLLGAFQRWQDPAWKKLSMSVR